MQFQDPEVQRVFQRNAECVQNEDATPRELCGVLAAYDWFRLTDGEQSPRVNSIIEALLSPELRPALRRWYRRWGNGMNENALRFRDRLSKLAGEKFG